MKFYDIMDVHILYAPMIRRHVCTAICEYALCEAIDQLLIEYDLAMYQIRTFGFTVINTYPEWYDEQI